MVCGPLYLWQRQLKPLMGTNLVLPPVSPPSRAGEGISELQHSNVVCVGSVWLTSCRSVLAAQAEGSAILSLTCEQLQLKFLFYTSRDIS